MGGALSMTGGSHQGGDPWDISASAETPYYCQSASGQGVCLPWWSENPGGAALRVSPELSQRTWEAVSSTRPEKGSCQPYAPHGDLN
jgi:hypothetical protein